MHKNHATEIKIMDKEQNIYQHPGQVDGSNDYATTASILQLSQEITPKRNPRKFCSVTKVLIAGCVLNFVLIVLLAATLFYLQTRAATKSEVDNMISQVEQMVISPPIGSSGAPGPIGPPGPAGTYVIYSYIRTQFMFVCTIDTSYKLRAWIGNVFFIGYSWAGSIKFQLQVACTSTSYVRSSVSSSPRMPSSSKLTNFTLRLQ